MVVPHSPTPYHSQSPAPYHSPTQTRPQFLRRGSWRNIYVKISNRKLQAEAVVPAVIEQRCVKFDESCNATHELPPVAASEDELIWYKKSDYDAFERDRQLTALQYRTIRKKGRPYIERGQHTVRGLEELFDLDDSQRRVATSSRSGHLRRVLAEQAEQRKEGTCPDEAMLREVSCKSSREARQRSAALGEADALAGYVSSSRSLQRQAAGVMHKLSRKLQA